MEIWVKLGVLLSVIAVGEAIMCYQCDSNEDNTCPDEEWFDPSINALVDCSGFESHVPGPFCMKIVQKSPGWHNWQKVTRRCGSRSQYGVTWGCRWDYEDNGIFKEVCYCADFDGCNSAGGKNINIILLVVTTLALLYRQFC